MDEGTLDYEKCSRDDGTLDYEECSRDDGTSIRE